MNEKIARIYWDESKRTRIFGDDYSKEGEEISPPMSLTTDLTSFSATRSCRITDDIMLKMIERSDNVALVSHNVEECHLVSQKRFKEHKGKDGNIIYLSRLMHEHFDAINLEDKCPSFLIRYVSHTPLQKFLCGVKEFTKHKVIVDVCFRPKTELSALIALLKSGVQKIDAYTYRTELYFDDGEEAKYFLDEKLKSSQEKCSQYDKTVDMLLSDP
jgi:hypothetical protein